MTREEILAMVPGRELDAHIALLIFQKEVTNVGHHYFIEPLDKVLPSYSTDISAAWEVVEKFDDGKHEITLTKAPYYDENTWIIGIKKMVVISFDDDIEVIFDVLAEAKTAPEAIAKAALLAVLEATP